MIQEITKAFILQTLKRHQKQLEGYGVRAIGLFGSYVRNEAGKNSDIDLLVDIQKEKKNISKLHVAQLLP